MVVTKLHSGGESCGLLSFCFKPLALGVKDVSSLPVFRLLVGMGGFLPGPGSAHLGVGVGQSVELDLSCAAATTWFLNS